MQALKKFIMNKISKIDSEYNYETGTDENVFKTTTHAMVDIQ